MDSVTEQRLLVNYEFLFINDGKVSYMFNAGGGPMMLKTETTFNDGQWHKLTATRAKKDGTLSIDDEEQGKNTAPGGPSYVNGLSKIYYGGLPKGSAAFSKLPSILSKVPYKGALHSIQMFGKPMGLPTEPDSVPKAFELYNDGVSVPTGGYGYKDDKYKIGTNHQVELSFTSRKRDGYLFYNSGNGDYLTIRLTDDGSVLVECNNGGGKFMVSVKPKTSVCDGNEHSVTLVKKGKSLTLTVDGITSEYTTTKSSSSADTSAPIYIAGAPLDALKKNKVGQFNGCVSNVKLNKKSFDFGELSFTGSARRGCGTPLP